MDYLSSNPTKDEMLEFLKNRPKDELKTICRAINEDCVNECEIPETGSREDLINGLRPVSKAVLFSAINDQYSFDEDDEDSEDEARSQKHKQHDAEDERDEEDED